MICSISAYGLDGPYRDWPAFAHRLELTALMEEVFPVRTTQEWLKRLQDQDVPVAPILGVDRVLTDPQVRHRRMVTEVIHPGLGPVPPVGTPIKVDGVLGLTPAAPPRLGEHSDAILTGLLGFPAERVAALRSAGVVA